MVPSPSGLGALQTNMLYVTLDRQSGEFHLLFFFLWNFFHPKHFGASLIVTRRLRKNALYNSYTCQDSVYNHMPIKASASHVESRSISTVT